MARCFSGAQTLRANERSRSGGPGRSGEIPIGFRTFPAGPGQKDERSNGRAKPPQRIASPIPKYFERSLASYPGARPAFQENSVVGFGCKRFILLDSFRSHLGRQVLASMAGSRVRCKASPQEVAIALEPFVIGRHIIRYNNESQVVGSGKLDVASIEAQYDLLAAFHNLDERLSFRKSTLTSAPSM